jgi:hypothetical protein
MRLIDATPLVDECKECSAIEWNKSVYTTWVEAEEDFMQRLLDAPTVDAVEVKHGRWSPVTYGLGVTVTRWMCSNCKKYENSYSRTNYCPNCGADMRGDGNGN